jgi:hypothetical protein
VLRARRGEITAAKSIGERLVPTARSAVVVAIFNEIY